jgi:hypothetical protein
LGRGNDLVQQENHRRSQKNPTVTLKEAGGQWDVHEFRSDAKRSSFAAHLGCARHSFSPNHYTDTVMVAETATPPTPLKALAKVTRDVQRQGASRRKPHCCRPKLANWLNAFPDIQSSRFPGFQNWLRNITAVLGN